MLPVVISGKDHFSGGYKTDMFLWEARLLRMIRKTTGEIDFTLYLFHSVQMGRYNISFP